VRPLKMEKRAYFVRALLDGKTCCNGSAYRNSSRVRLQPDVPPKATLRARL